jgi:peptidoglycan LD-endopeptidase CwlK
MNTLVFCAEVCPSNQKLLAFVRWWVKHGLFPLKLLCGNRTDAEQAKLYAQGRSAPGAVVTYAKRAKHSAHGHSGAIDVTPVRALFSNGRVSLVYLGDEDDVAVRAEALRRFGLMADIAEKQFGLEPGRNFPGLHDLPHIQDPAWRDRPLNKGVAP